MSELQKELDKDQAFINEVQERIYCESDDWEDLIAEPEWIMQMTDIADKYLRWFKAAENGRRRVVQDKAKLLEMSKPKLNENQEIVLEHLKKMSPPKLGVSAMVTVYCLVDDNINDNWQEYSEKIPGRIEALQKLSVAEENQVLQAFSAWALEQEEE